MSKLKEKAFIQGRLEYLRGELRAERISYGELAELQDLKEHIDAGDVELLEAAGVPEGETPQQRQDILIKKYAGFTNPQCCDEPRGFVGGICDNCGGWVQPEEKGEK